MIELKITAETVEALGKDVLNLAGALLYDAGAEKVVAVMAAPKPEKPAPKPKNKPVPKPAAEEPVDEVKTITVENCKSVTAEALRSGKRTEVKELLDKYAAKNVAEIAEGDRAAYIEEVQTL
jgi:hypothetical protein